MGRVLSAEEEEPINLDSDLSDADWPKRTDDTKVMPKLEVGPSEEDENPEIPPTS